VFEIKINTKLGEVEAEQEGEKYKVNVAPNSGIAQALLKFEPKNWVTLLEKCRSDGMESEEILSATNKDGNLVVLFASTPKSLTTLINNIGDAVGINTPVTPSVPLPQQIEVEEKTLKMVKERLDL